MALLGFIGFLSMSSQRMCITVALVCMLNQTAMTDITGSGDDQPPLMTVAPTTLNGSRHNASVGGGRVATSSAVVRACGAIPEIFVLNTSDFSRINVSPVSRLVYYGRPM